MAQRKNRSIVGAAKVMLHYQSLYLFLWVEACSTVVYVLNKSLHRALGCKTPEEMFTGKMPEIGHFRIFGCLTYSHVLFEKKTKLEATGVGAGPRSYRKSCYIGTRKSKEIVPEAAKKRAQPLHLRQGDDKSAQLPS